MKEKYEKPQVITEIIATEIVRAEDCCQPGQTVSDFTSTDLLIFEQKCGCECTKALY